MSAVLMLPAGAAFAQAAPAGAASDKAQEVQEVVVTGSRIARRDYTSNSPIVTVSSQALMSQADLQIQSTLNKLPQFTADQNLMGRDNTGDTQPTPTHSVGISTLSLRGLGPNRNLVLIDGQRGAPVNGELVVDLNTIPTAMIDHVETITGGASAVYGADAIGGVVNFIMKKNFQGLDLDLQEGVNQHGGDGKQFSASVVMGTNFADNRGNVTVSLERFTQDPSWERNRPYVVKGWSDPTVAPVNGFPMGQNYTANGQGIPQSLINSLFPGTTPSSLPANSNFWFAGNQLYSGVAGYGVVAPGGVPFDPYQPNGTSYAYQNVVNPATHQVVQLIKNNETVGYVQAPLDRWSMFANGHYDINDWVTAEFQANFAQTHTETLLTQYPPSIVTGWSTNIPYNQVTDDPASPGFIPLGQAGAQHPVSATFAQLLNARTGIGNAATTPWQLLWLGNINSQLPPRGTTDQNTVFQIRAGLKGKLPQWNWNWELTGSHSESEEYSVARGDYSQTRYQALMSAPGYGQGTFQGNYFQPNGSYFQSPVPTSLTTLAGQAANPGLITSPNAGFGAATVKCTTGFYNAIFNGATPSADCLAAISAPIQSMNFTKQDLVEFDASGDLFNLPAGTVKGSIGADYRRDQLVFNPDILSSNESFTDQVIGVYPVAYSNVSQDAKEVYGELSIPVLGNLPFLKNFTLNPGARFSSYDTSPGGWTYKILGDYQVNDWIRLRGGYNLAVRTPNLGELYEGLTEQFGQGTDYGDPCSLLSQAPFGAGGAAVAQGQATATSVANKGGLAGAQNALAICKALMTPSAQQYFYNTAGVSQPAPGPTSFGWHNVQGNPNLLPETAKTFTAGIVLKSPFQNPLFSRMNVSIDYYKIHIDDAIEFASVDYVYQQCLNQPAATALNSLYCQAIQRSPQFGGQLLTGTPAANSATIDTSGVDLQFDWTLRLADLRESLPGSFSLSLVGSFLGNYDTISAPGQPVERWYGTLGPTLTGTNGGAYAYKLNTQFGYSIGPAQLFLNWRHLPKVNAASAVAPGNVTLPTNAYDIFDLNANFALPHGLSLRAGIQNLFDVSPPTTGATSAIYVNGLQQTVASTGQGTTNPSFYDVLGRRFYVGLKARF
ncbi:MAG TPA: TonB-dependent receptor [Caulobacteraceae bacterium]|jgi:outer membrane receptor for ferrienterochelin and colicin